MYDTIIIGCGPSGMTCALYLLRAGKKVLVLEKSMYGGQVVLSNNIQNYPSLKSIDGVTFATQFYEQIKSLGAEVKFEEAISCDFYGDVKTVVTSKNEYQAKSVYIATGAKAKHLEVEGEKKYYAKGVSYCATCDGALYKNKVVAVVGGGNTGLEDCLYLSSVASKVYLIHRRDEFRGDKVSQDKVMEKVGEGKVELVLSSQIVEICGEDKVNKIAVKNLKTNQLCELNVDGVFIAIGRNPETDIFSGLEVNSFGNIITDDRMHTNISGVFAGGDVRDTNLRQIITACSDGAVASANILEFLRKC